MTEGYHRLRHTAGLLDLSGRGRLCLTGADCKRFLHGQVTNEVQSLPVGSGCYAALVSAKGKIQSDLNLYQLQDEILLDFEPGLADTVMARLDHYIIADDVQVLDAAPHYSLLSLQGPKSRAVLESLPADFKLEPPGASHQFTLFRHPGHEADCYCMNLPRTAAPGFDLFIPAPLLEIMTERLLDAARPLEGGRCGPEALEIRRIESGIPRFGADGDMDPSNLVSETGIEDRAISTRKGCYIGQEIIARIRTYGQVTKRLRGLKLDPALDALPRKGDKLFAGDLEAGYVTTATRSPAMSIPIALGYVRREQDRPGGVLTARTAQGDTRAEIVHLPFNPAQ